MTLLLYSVEFSHSPAPLLFRHFFIFCSLLTILLYQVLSWHTNDRSKLKKTHNSWQTEGKQDIIRIYKSSPVQVRAVQTQFPQAHTHLLHSIRVSAPSSNTSSSRAHSSSHTQENIQVFLHHAVIFLTVAMCVSAWAWHYFSHTDDRSVSCSWWTHLNWASSLRFHPTARSEHQHTETWDTQTECCLITICAL